MNICERLKEERKRLGLSQTEFARLGGVGKTTQINYESGERSPDADYLAAIAIVGVDVQYILTETRSSMALAPEERFLIKQFRASPKALQQAALRVLLGADQESSAVTPKYTVDFSHAVIHQAAGGDIVNKKR